MGSRMRPVAAIDLEDRLFPSVATYESNQCPADGLDAPALCHGHSANNPHPLRHLWKSAQDRCSGSRIAGHQQHHQRRPDQPTNQRAPRRRRVPSQAILDSRPSPTASLFPLHPLASPPGHDIRLPRRPIRQHPRLFPTPSTHPETRLERQANGLP